MVRKWTCNCKRQFTLVAMSSGGRAWCAKHPGGAARGGAKTRGEDERLTSRDSSSRHAPGIDTENLSSADRVSRYGSEVGSVPEDRVSRNSNSRLVSDRRLSQDLREVLATHSVRLPAQRPHIERGLLLPFSIFRAKRRVCPKRDEVAKGNHLCLRRNWPTRISPNTRRIILVTSKLNIISAIASHPNLNVSQLGVTRVASVELDGSPSPTSEPSTVSPSDRAEPFTG